MAIANTLIGGTGKFKGVRGSFDAKGLTDFNGPGCLTLYLGSVLTIVSNTISRLEKG